jgi:hypothetical protein
MKGNLEILEKEITFNLDDISIKQYNVIGRKQSETIPMFVENYKVGETITLITSNMPDKLINEIDSIIKTYCNH